MLCGSGVIYKYWSAWVSHVLLDSLLVNGRTDSWDFHYILCYCKNASHFSHFWTLKYFSILNNFMIFRLVKVFYILSQYLYFSEYLKYFFACIYILCIVNTCKKYFAQDWFYILSTSAPAETVSVMEVSTRPQRVWHGAIKMQQSSS